MKHFSDLAGRLMSGRGSSDKTSSDKASPGKDKPKHKRRRTLGFMALEPRIMYDGAAAVTVAAHHHHHDGALADAGQAGGAPTPSGGDGHWHHEAAPTGPMPTVTTWVKDPTEIVFIDPRAPDYQILASGVKPGVEVVVLDPNSDGVEQIANFLQRHPDPNLTTIDIVAHGQDGMLFLGNAVLDNDTVGQYAAQLKIIGSAMQPGGDLMLYGCDVAADPSGLALLAQITDETGVNVAAATADVGSAALGGTWSLTATSGQIEASAPFTAATLAAYPDLLNADLFVTASDGSTGSLFIDKAGTVVTPSATLAGTVHPQQIVLDTADGVYFVIDNEDSGARIYEGQISQALLGNGALTAIFADTAQENGFAADAVAGLQVDSANKLIYFVDNQNNNAQSLQEASLFEKISYSSTPLINAAVTPLGTVPNGGNFNGGVAGFAMDFANPAAALAVFAVNVGGSNFFGQIGPGSATLYSASVAANAAAHSVTTIAALPNLNIPATEGFFPNSFDGSLAIDDHNGAPIVYFALQDGHNSNGSLSSTSLGLYSYQLGSSATAPTVIFQGGNPANGVGPTPVLDAITIDTATGEYYATGAAQPAGAGSPQFGVYVGSLTSNSVPTLDGDFSAVLPAGGHPEGAGVAVDESPVVTASGTPTNYVEGGNPDTIDTSLTVTSSTAQTLAGATVSIANNQSGDVLSFNGGSADHFSDGGIISSSFSAGTLTLSGVASVADYQTALDNVKFTSTAASTAPRTVNFSVTDGLLASNTATDTVDIAAPPTIGGTGNIADFWQSHNAVTMLDNAITATDGVNITSATVTLSGSFSTADVLADNGVNDGSTVLGNITATYNSTSHTLTLSGSDTAAHYQTALREVTYNFTGDPTNGGADKTRTVTWSITDANNLTGAAGSTTTLDVFAAPVVNLGGTTTVTDNSGGSAVVVDSGVTVTDLNGINIASATIAIGGAQTGDALSDNGVSNGGLVAGTSIHATFSGGTLTLSGSDTLAHYNLALDEVQFSTTSTNTTARTLTWTANDQAGGQTNNSAGVTSTVDVILPPHITGAGTTATFTGGSGTAVVLDSTIAVTDAANPTLASATVSIVSPVTGDTLNFTNNGSSEGNIAISSDAGGQLVLSSAGGTATLAQWDTALDSITYSFSPANGDPTGGGSHTSRTIDWVVNDGVTNSVTATSTLDTVHVAPTVTAGATASFNIGTASGFGPLLDSTLTVGDVDSAGNLSGATIVIANAQTGDTLSFANQNGISGTFSSGTLTLSGTATIAQYQTALESITFNSTSTSTAARTIDWTVKDGAANSTLATSTVNITTVPLTTTETITLTTDADQDGGASPGDTVTGNVTITNTGSGAVTNVQLQEVLNGLTLLPGTVEVTPLAVNDTYSLVGNTPLTVDAAHGLLANDIELNGDALSVSAVNGSAANVGTAIAITGGSVTLNSDGSFTFTPTAGFAGTTSLTYLVHDAAGNSDQTATVTLNVAAPEWYVLNNGGSDTTGTGTSANPFATIGKAVSTAAANTNAGAFSHGVDNTIFALNTGQNYTASSGITLANGEILLGSGSNVVLPNGILSTPSATFSVSSGTAVTLGLNNTISGINIIETGSGAGIADVSGGFGTLSMSDIEVTTASGTGISLTHGGTVDVTGLGNTIDSTSGTALDIANTTIGSSGITFKNISASGGVNGIILDNTGTSGGLTVTGDGTSNANDTGGGILNTTGDGVVLINTQSVVLTHMDIENTAGNGVFGSGVNGFVSDWNVFSANGASSGDVDATADKDAGLEGAIRFGSDPAFTTNPANGLSGGAIGSATETRIDDTTIGSAVAGSGALFNGVTVFNESGVLTQLDVHNTTIAGSRTGSGMRVGLSGSAQASIDLQNSNFGTTTGGGNDESGFEADASGGAILSVNATGNTFIDNAAHAPVNNPSQPTDDVEASGLEIQGGDTTQVAAYISGNTPSPAM